MDLILIINCIGEGGNTNYIIQPSLSNNLKKIATACI